MNRLIAAVVFLGSGVVLAQDGGTKASSPELRQGILKPRVLDPGKNPDSSSAGRYGTDSEAAGMMGTRNPMGGSSWSGYPAPKADPRTKEPKPLPETP
ncbi:MAG: hypothetical protein ACT4TC_19985 [Myxococcaceae bacterium]